GEIFVFDGHGTNKILKFSKDGTFIKEIGKKAAQRSLGATFNGPGEFVLGHALQFDSRGRLFAADALDHKIQIFDQDLNFLEEWRQFGSPAGLYIAPDDTIYSADPNDFQGVVIGSAKDGRIREVVPHAVGEGIFADGGGNLWVGDTVHPGYAKTLMKFVKK